MKIKFLILILFLNSCTDVDIYEKHKNNCIGKYFIYQHVGNLNFSYCSKDKPVVNNNYLEFIDSDTGKITVISGNIVVTEK